MQAQLLGGKEEEKEVQEREKKPAGGTAECRDRIRHETNRLAASLGADRKKLALAELLRRSVLLSTDAATGVTGAPRASAPWRECMHAYCGDARVYCGNARAWRLYVGPCVRLQPVN